MESQQSYPNTDSITDNSSMDSCFYEHQLSPGPGASNPAALSPSQTFTRTTAKVVRSRYAYIIRNRDVCLTMRIELACHMINFTFSKVRVPISSRYRTLKQYSRMPTGWSLYKHIYILTSVRTNRNR